MYGNPGLKWKAGDDLYGNRISLWGDAHRLEWLSFYSYSLTGTDCAKRDWISASVPQLRGIADGISHLTVWNIWDSG